MSALFRILRTTPMRVLSLCLLATAAWAAPVKPQLQITGYLISADLDPSVNRLSATVEVTFTALEDLTTPTFELNNGLQITKVTDAQGHSLESERLTNNSTVRFTLSTPLAKGASTTYHFEYSGTLKGADTSPVEGIKLASVEDPISILLYAGRWFPMTGLFTNRFTAEMHIRVPSDERVVGSGSGVAASKSLPGNRTEHTFKWAKPGFPGTIIAGKFLEPITAGNMRVYVTEKHKDHAHDFASLGEREYLFMSGTFGQPESTRMNLVELPDDAVSAAWAPEIAAIAGNRIAARNEQRLLSNTLAHQWWGSQVSPATMNDAWITNGMSRYAELMYLEDSSGKNAFQSAITDVSAGALAYDTEPLTTIGRLDPFSPQFQSMTLEKGAMVFHMLRWEMGDEVFTKFLRTILSQYTDKSVHTSNVQTIAEKESSLQLESFFAQWLDGTGAPAFADKYSVFRLGDNKGFRTIGAITQDLDLFRMPIELRIETDGKTEIRRVDVSGSDSQYSIETFGRPRRISIDPDNWLLKSTPDLAVRVAVLRGQEQVAQGDLTAALIEYQKALDTNKNSSLAAYRIGEIFFMQRNYQSAANSFRDALRGDGDPKWVEVWSHIELARIFDCTGQRDRAVNEYRLAVQSNDNTQGAVNEARASMQAPYKCQRGEN
ncbi:M1 family aminopeptidase [Tunturiibacter gelidoferens]|uniref:Aminopeptidase N n=2 Tax=Tunturiibacter TaxID=3154218 RepID=A0A7Y9NNS1_9BACT|nr:M1 family aminopeptidase [Edaphobacter lichenicola]MBB5338212.1 aminopeptidase N [Edaphobacter lichenicola]NYF52547.1 aminopeptidase N [Edaphobacter lichenicola]